MTDGAVAAKQPRASRASRGRERLAQPSLGGATRNLRSSLCGLLLLMSSLTSCARAKPPPPVDVSSLPPLARSSIAAIVQSRDKLGLTDEQVGRLEEIDRERQKADDVISDAAAEREQTAKAAAKASHATGPVPAGGGAGGPGGGRGRRYRGSPTAGAGGPPTEQDRLDDDDTKAFLDAEQVLTEAQRDEAREIASDYRAELYERRDLERRAAAANK
jgi:hypothetical protein